MSKVYEIVTSHIISSLEKSVVPWHQPWKGGKDGNMPRNIISKKEYRGVNVWLLGCQGYTSPWWMTYPQAKQKGGQVRKGEKSTPVIFWKMLEDKTDPKKKIPLLRFFNAFNLAQVDGIEMPEEKVEEKPTFDPIEECEKIVLAYKTIPKLDHGGNRACYMPSFDRICMPEKESFIGREEYYSTLFHELVHSTGHESRLNRDGIMNPIRFGSHEYSFEELVAECGAAFLCARAGIIDRTLDNSVAYINSWIAKLKREPKWIVEASSKASKASEYICPLPVEVEEDEEEVAA